MSSDSSVTSTGFFAEYYSYLAKCEEGWLGHEGACYSFEEEPKTAPEAQLECEKAGANLASVHSEEEYSFISANAPSSPLWIGLKKHGSRSIWTDGSAFDDVDVSSKFHFEDGFALVSKDQSIRDDLPGDKEYPFVCKKLLKPMSVGSISHQS
ncbi:unnamed protein product [Darwinula stevensoni]|uniref:C-type lectin domain-containing protein n=1 Tax=Darwinula stevensoni TaxID=69355 RepID=A0A7R9A1C4_9CRUS|nr:unnamed protein product [Darwinula stevensoni]CAG0883162.1 unnamed protein product [Darwinula stevensoni]